MLKISLICVRGSTHLAGTSQAPPNIGVICDWYLQIECMPRAVIAWSVVSCCLLWLAVTIGAANWELSLQLVDGGARMTVLLLHSCTFDVFDLRGEDYQCSASIG